MLPLLDKRDPSKLVLSFSPLPHSPLNDLTTLMCFALEAAVQAPGAPPKGGLVQVRLDRYTPRAAIGRHTDSMHVHIFSETFKPRQQRWSVCGVRAAVPPRHVREAGEEEERALNQLSS